MTAKNFSQEHITEIWSSVWKNTGDVELGAMLGNRLFLDAYERIHNYFPSELQSAVEIGTGTGRVGLSLARDFPKTNFLLTDISVASLEITKKLAGKLGLDNATFSIEDLMGLTFLDNSVDCIVMDCVIPHVENHQKALREIARVLKPGGYLLMTNVNTWNLPHTLVRKISNLLPGGYQYGQETSFTHNELTKLLEQNNISVVFRDGFAVGYGIFRLKNKIGLFAFLGRLVNRAGKICDKYTKRWCSRNFGFQTIVLARKNSLK